MSIIDYIEELERLKQLAVDRWGNLSSFELNIVDGSFDWLIENLEVKRGQVQPDEQLAASMDQFVAAVMDIINNNQGFQSNLTKFLGDLNDIKRNMSAFHITTNNFNINTAGVKEVQKMIVNEVIDQYSGNGLNANFATPLRDLIFRNILGGMNMKQAKEVLRTYILSGQDGSGKLGQYLLQTAQQGVDSYTGMINQQIKKEFQTTGFIISGSLIETSSRQCIYAVEHARNGYLSNKEWERVLDIARSNSKARLIEGTTLSNLAINKLHWGCRHDFTPVIINEKKEQQQKTANISEKVDELLQTANSAGPEIDQVAKKVAQKFDAVVTPINYKSRESIVRKAKNEYGGDVSQVKDAVRTTIVSPASKLNKIINELSSLPDTKIKIQKAETDNLGYSGAIANYKTKDGIFAEIQVNSPEMIYAKEPESVSRVILGEAEFNRIKEKFKVEGGKGHAIYEEYRLLSVNDVERRLELEQISRNYYNLFR